MGWDWEEIIFLGGCAWVFEGGFFFSFFPSSSLICPLFSPFQMFRQLKSKPPKSPFAPLFFPPPTPPSPPLSNPPTSPTSPNKTQQKLKATHIAVCDKHRRYPSSKKENEPKKPRRKRKKKEKEKKL